MMPPDELASRLERWFAATGRLALEFARESVAAGNRVGVLVVLLDEDGRVQFQVLEQTVDGQAPSDEETADQIRGILSFALEVAMHEAPEGMHTEAV